MDEISLKLDLDRVTLNDLVMLEDQAVSARQMRDFLARCAVGADGEPLGMDQAVETIGNMPLSRVRTLASNLSETLKGVGQVPPKKGKR